MAFFKTVRAGLKVDTFETADVLLDALISINTPVVLSRLQLDAHIDLPEAVCRSLLHARPKIYQQGRPGNL